MKNYIVRLTEDKPEVCDATICRLKDSSPKARRARTLLQVDALRPVSADQ